MIVDADGPPCPGRCPNHGCLEALVSGHALGVEGARLAEERPDSALGAARERGDRITGLLVTELALAGDEVARGAVVAMGANLGLGIVTLANVFNPEVVVVGGGAIGAGELLLEPAREVVAVRALPITRERLRIVATHFGAEAGMVGAACMALEAAGIDPS
jgi:glucokinase